MKLTPEQEAECKAAFDKHFVEGGYQYSWGAKDNARAWHATGFAAGLAAREPEVKIDDDLPAVWVPLPKGLHPDTMDLVSQFAFRLAIKLRKAEKKYGYSNGWKEPDWLDECRQKLSEHVAKGDPLDVAAYCAFLMWHGEPTAKPAPINSPAVSAGWKCPNCSGAHPQHVKTCPVDNRTMGEKLRGSNA